MKKLSLIAIALCLFAGSVSAQTKLPGLDKSPMDMSYCPANYVFREIDTAKVDPLLARIIYSRPQKKDRVIFGGLVPYGKVWRLGANEATEVDFFHPVAINGVAVESGRYTIYAIPDSAKWTIILNKETDVWGSFSYDKSKDVVRMDVPVEKQSTSTEALTIVFTKADTMLGQNLVIVWDDVKVTLPIQSRVL